MARNKVPTNWFTSKMNRLQVQSNEKKYKKIRESEDGLFQIFVVECQGTKEFELIIEAGYLHDYNLMRKTPQDVDAASKKYKFVSPLAFIGAIRRWVDINPSLFEKLETKKLLQIREYQIQVFKKIEDSRIASKLRMKELQAEAQLRREIATVRESERLDALRANYLSDKQLMIADALIYRDFAEKLERSKRKSSRKKWRRELSENRFAQYLKVGAVNQNEYRKLILSGVFDRKGIDFDGPGFVYLMRHQSLGALKIGIASNSSSSDRVSVHQSKGWELLKKWEFRSTWHAYLIEQEIISWWRDELELENGVSPVQMTQGGFSETAPDSLELLSTTISRIETLSNRPNEKKRKENSENSLTRNVVSSGCWCGGRWKTRTNNYNSVKVRSCSRWPYCLGRPNHTDG